MIRRLAIAAALALAMHSPAQAEDRVQDPAAGEYRDTSSFEMFHGLLLRPDGTYDYALSVGALDRRSAGSWRREGDTIVFTTTPRPVPPEIVEGPGNTAPDAPFLQVTWPNGKGIAGVTFRLGCGDGSTLDDYTQAEGWSPPAGDCSDPQWIELDESIQDIRSPRFDISGRKGGLRFVIVPNDFGVTDLTGATARIEGGRLVMQLTMQEHSYRVVFNRVAGK